MHIETTSLQGVFLITPSRICDHRGSFSEIWNRKAWLSLGIDIPNFVQENHSLSHDAGTIRGMHFQAPPHAQGKLVRCVRGRIFDVVLDIRKASTTFGKWTGTQLSHETGKCIWVPPGFLHGFMTLEPNSEIIYNCTDYYTPEAEGTVNWDSCAITWPQMNGRPVISSKDKTAVNLKDFETPFTQ